MAAKRAIFALALVIGAGLAPPAATAAPRVDIRARTQLVFDGVRKAYDGMVITGQLRDKMTGQGISGQTVTATVNGVTYEATTDRDGEFSIPLAGATGKQDIALSFAGGGALDPSDLALAGVEVDKQPLALTVTPLPVEAGMSIQVDAKTGDTPVMVPIELRAGAAEADELPVVGQVTSGNSFVLTRAKAGGAGRRRVQAVFRGDAVYAAAQGEATFELSTRTATTFTLDAREVAYEDRVAGSGKVTDEDGKGIARAPVTLLAGDRRLGQTSTTKDGGFRFSLEAKLLGQGAHALVAVVDTSSPFLAPSSSDPPVVVRIAAPQPVPIAFTAAAFGATALVIAGFFLARSRPWERRKRRRQAPADQPAPTDDKGEVKGGLVQAKPTVLSTLRRPSDLGVSGTVRDAVRGRPVAGATVRLRLGDAGGGIAQEHVAITGDDGGFALEDLAPGDWKAKVAAPGHVTERFGLTVPHRGELRGVRVDLVPVREQVFALYKVAAQPVLPEARLWGVWSPRQIVDHVRKKRPTAALAELTDFVEEAYFSARVPDEDVLPAAREHVERAVRERDRGRAA